jgi:DNA-binding transcriptional MerR regulator
MEDMSIGCLSALTGVNRPTVRFDEQIGLLPRPKRIERDQRRLDAEKSEALSSLGTRSGA